LRRITDLQDGRVLVSNDLGDYAVLTASESAALSAGGASLPALRRMDLDARNLLHPRPPEAWSKLERAAHRTRKSFLLEGPALHIFVVTLRCDHSCQYCQVSRAKLDASGFDMSEDDAEAALDRVFESPAETLTIEFQGGEPALRFDLVRRIVEGADRRNADAGKALRFSMVSTLHHLDRRALEFCAEHGIHLSTSIDGGPAVHDAQRPNPTRDAWSRTIGTLSEARAVLGHEGVVALPTVTRRALDDPRGLVDLYRELGFSSIFLRPVSPYGFARKTRRSLGYDMPAFLRFYETALDYILELNTRDIAFEEVYASVLLRHIMTPFHSGYVDLRSPAGAGLGVLVYNYDGQVYPSDEARMAAETGDARFALGPVSRPLDELLASPAMRWLRAGAVAEELPGCRECAFVPFCGADPVYHAAVQGDPIGRRGESDFCAKHLGLFRLLFRRLADADPETLRTFTAWATARPRDAVRPTAFVER
jgi:His-Xaa-Ser system radical SAM maturase HxsB